MTTENIVEGAEITYKLSLYGVPMKWVSEIQNWNPGKEFVDVQRKGPYSLWYHHHTFESIRSGTLIIDEVHYAVPMGPLGIVFALPLIKIQLQRIFSHRVEAIKKIFS